MTTLRQRLEGLATEWDSETSLATRAALSVCADQLRAALAGAHREPPPGPPRCQDCGGLANSDALNDVPHDDALREALRPFAELARRWDEVHEFPDDFQATLGITVGDLRRARAALRGPSESGHK